MFRKILSVVTIVETLSPEKPIETAEQFALENPEDCELRSWVLPSARFEGVLFLFLMWRSETSYSTFKRFFGVIGLQRIKERAHG